jgi:hypothetical protein
MSKKMMNCKTCDTQIAKSAKTCPSCGAKNKKGKLIELLWKIPVGVFGVLLLISAISNTSTPTGLPVCDSSRAIQEVKRTYKNAPIIGKLGFKILTLENMQERSFDEESQKRVCTARAITNADEIDIIYQFTKTDDGQYLIQMKQDSPF